MLQAGDRIDIWVVERALGAGGMGSVYRCHNHTARRILAAVKVLDASLRTMPGARERFVREAEILFQLDHPGIVKVRNVRTDTDPPYLEMEYVVGESLEKVLERGALPLDRALDLMDQLLAAVDYLHTRGIRHRDIKPANVLIRRDGTLKLVDFGLAVEADVTRITQAGMTFGTVSYAPPEWMTPDKLDAVLWDVYAAGVLLYELLVGGVAFPVSGGTTARQQAMQVMLAKQSHAPLDPGPIFPDAVRSLVRDMTHADASSRLARADLALGRLRTIPRNTLPPLELPPLEEPTAEVANMTWVEPVAPDPAVTLSAAHKMPGPTLAVPEEKPARSGLPWLLAGATLLAAVGVSAAVGVGVLWALRQSEVLEVAPRDVGLVVSGLPVGTPVTLWLDGAAIPASSQPFSWSVVGVQPGAHTVTWAVGADCGGCADVCPSWCGSGALTLDVPAGEGAWTSAIPLAPPAARPVRVAPVGLPPDVAGTVTSGAATAPLAGASATISLLPGLWPVLIVAGACPDGLAPCAADGACPPGCVSFAGQVEVPWGEGPVSYAPELTWVAPVAERPVPDRPSRPGPDASPPPAASGGSGSLVTVGAFSSWVGANPDWMRDAAIAAGRADDLYLPGWSGASPPAGVSGSAPVTGVSWYAASAFCRSKGGLAALDAPPASWTEGPAPAIEWRVDGTRAAWRTSDSTTSTAVKKAQALAIAGFRCAR